MNRLLVASLLAMLVLVPTFVGAGDKRPARAEVRKAIEKSLPYLEKDGLAWINKRDCMSCHVVTFMLWSHNEAKARGIAVDAKKVAEWTDWSMQKSLAEHTWFKLDEKAHKGLPEPLRPKLEDLVGQGFEFEKDFLAAAGKLLQPDEMKQHQAAILKQAALPKKGTVNDGGGLDTMTQLFLARDPNAKDAKDAAFYASTAQLIVKWQEADGTWKAAGQLPSRRWPRPIADQTTTLWTILALASYEQPDPNIKKSIDKASAAVKKSKPGENHEWLVARLLFDHKLGESEQAASLRANLLKRQNDDGGWSAIPGGKSEAFSTGQSLYALRLTGMAPDDPILGKAQKYLLETQNENGAWNVPPGLISTGGPDRLKKLESIHRYWGSAWASIGLSRSLPDN